MQLDSPRPTLVITGAAGFLGSALVRESARKGFPVVAVSRSPPAAAIEGVTALHLADYAQLWSPPDAVLIHLAEPPGLVDAANAGDQHVTALMGTLAALLAQPWQHVVYSSSVAVYGDQGMKQHHPCESVRPTDTYGLAKVACENAVLGSGGTVLRLANIYGPGLSRGTILADLLAQLDAVGPIRVRNAGSERDYLWVDDAAAGLLAAAARQVGGVFNLASGRTVSVRELAERVLKAAGQPDRLVESNAESFHSRISLDIADTIQKLVWRPRTSLEDGVIHLVGTFQASRDDSARASVCVGSLRGLCCRN